MLARLLPFLDDADPSARLFAALGCLRIAAAKAAATLEDIGADGNLDDRALALENLDAGAARPAPSPPAVARADGAPARRALPRRKPTRADRARAPEPSMYEPPLHRQDDLAALHALIRAGRSA